MNPQVAFDRVVASLHQAMLDDAHWPAASALIDEAVGARSNGLSVSEGFGDDARVYFAGFYRHGERRRDLERHYFEGHFAVDERVPRLRALPAGKLNYVPDLYTEKELKSSVAYNEGLRRLGVHQGLNVRFDRPDGLRIFWALGNPVAAGGWQSAQLDLVEHLMPHFRQFVFVRQALAAAHALGAGMAGLLDSTRIGVLHLDRGGAVLAANAVALGILRSGDGLSDKGGTLRAWLPKDHARLQSLLRRALPGFGCEAPAAGSMTVRRVSAPVRLGLHITPVGDAQADFGGRRVAALVLLVDPAIRPRIDPQRVSAALGLTPSEGRVSAMLAEGRSVREIAAATGYRESYVRWLLKQAYRKQGISGQVALVRLVLAADALPGH